MNIRSSRKDDLEILLKLNQEVFIDNQQYDSDLRMDWTLSEHGRNYFTRVLNDSECCILIAEEDNKPIGYISATPKVITYRKSKYVEIDNMGIVPGYRSKGIGSMLIEKCLKWAKTKGYQKMFVNSYFQNTKAITFYKRSGFLEIDVGLERNI